MKECYFLPINAAWNQPLQWKPFFHLCVICRRAWDCWRQWFPSAIFRQNLSVMFWSVYVVLLTDRLAQQQLGKLVIESWVCYWVLNWLCHRNLCQQALTNADLLAENCVYNHIYYNFTCFKKHYQICNMFYNITEHWASDLWDI